MSFDEPVDPRCPSVCCFNRTCSTWMQRGIEQLWIAQRMTHREECVMFAHRAQVHLQTTGYAPPSTAAELIEQLRERRTIQAEGRAA